MCSRSQFGFFSYPRFDTAILGVFNSISHHPPNLSIWSSPVMSVYKVIYVVFIIGFDLTIYVAPSAFAVATISFRFV